MNMKIWDLQIGEVVNRGSSLLENCGSAYVLIWGKLSIIMRDKFKALPDYKDMKTRIYLLVMIMGIKGVYCKFEVYRYLTFILYKS